MHISNLTIGLLLVAFLMILVTLIILKNNRITIKFAILWLIPSFVIILLALFPQLFDIIAKLFGFKTISNLVIGFLIVVLLFLIMSLTIIITGLSKKNVLLIQEVSLLKKKIDQIEERSSVH